MKKFGDYEVSNDTNANYTVMEQLIADYELDANRVMDLFTDWLGLQVLKQGFMEYVMLELGIEESEEDDD